MNSKEKNDMYKLRGELVRRLVTGAGYRSETDFAIQHGFQQSTFAGWISGRRGVKKQQLNTIARILGVSSEEIAVSVPRRRSKKETAIKDIKDLFEQMNDDQRARVIAYALGLIDGASSGDEL